MTGYPMLKVLVNWLLCWCLLVLCQQVKAGEPTTQSRDDGPSIELLEFLADFEDKQGKWIDPEKLENTRKQDRNTPRIQPKEQHNE